MVINLFSFCSSGHKPFFLLWCNQISSKGTRHNTGSNFLVFKQSITYYNIFLKATYKKREVPLHKAGINSSNSLENMESGQNLSVAANGKRQSTVNVSCSFSFTNNCFCLPQPHCCYIPHSFKEGSFRKALSNEASQFSLCFSWQVGVQQREALKNKTKWSAKSKHYSFVAPNKCRATRF